MTEHGIMIPLPEYEKVCRERDAAREEADRLRARIEAVEKVLDASEGACGMCGDRWTGGSVGTKQIRATLEEGGE